MALQRVLISTGPKQASERTPLTPKMMNDEATRASDGPEEKQNVAEDHAEIVDMEDVMNQELANTQVHDEVVHTFNVAECAEDENYVQTPEHG
jgi:hypothetical protein